MPIDDVNAQRVDVVTLNGLHQIRLLQSRTIGEYHNGRKQRVLDVVHSHRVHVPAEVQKVLDRVGHARHSVRVPRVRPIVSKQDRIGGGVVTASHPQHHHFTGTGLQRKLLWLGRAVERKVEKYSPSTR